MLPLILPLHNHLNEPVHDAYRLIFVNAFTLYYSYQHPIAFISRGRRVMRDDYWTRRRDRRIDHKSYIMRDMNGLLQTMYRNMDVPEPQHTMDFFEEVQKEFEHFGLQASTAQLGALDKKATAKRRVVL